MQGFFSQMGTTEQFSGSHKQRSLLGSFAEAMAMANKITAVANKITDGYLLKAKLGIFIEEQGPQVLRVFGRGPQIMKV